MSDDLGNRMKEYEKECTSSCFSKSLPVYARIDGKTFSKVTKNLKRPYDENFITCMIETTKYLVEHANALIGYTQSDEISLAWYPKTEESQIWFNGKMYKMLSVLAAMASVKFNQQFQFYFPETYSFFVEKDNLPVFDARVFQVPDINELSNAFLWREKDANKNAIFTVARHYFSHKELLNLSGKQLKDKLWQEKSINFDSDYPNYFKNGSWVKKNNYYVELSDEELSRIPESHRPNGPVLRSKLDVFSLEGFDSFQERKSFILNL